jgi:hypothetical protein
MRSSARAVAALVCIAVGIVLAAPGTAGADPLFATTISYDGPTVIAQGQSATVSARLTDGGFASVSGATVQITLGSGTESQSCTGTTDAYGRATCAIGPVTVPVGPQTITAEFAGDAFYGPSSDTAAATVFAFGGNFVLGDRTADSASTSGATVEFWGPDWSKENSLTAGGAPPSFKGFADAVDQVTTCGGAWTTRPGNSSNPPAAVPAYMAVLVSGAITKSGPVISGDVKSIVVVKTDPGYGPAPGHRGTGRVVAVVCTYFPPL